MKVPRSTWKQHLGTLIPDSCSMVFIEGWTGTAILRPTPASQTSIEDCKDAAWLG